MLPLLSNTLPIQKQCDYWGRFGISVNEVEDLFLKRYNRWKILEDDYRKFNLLRGLTKKITIVWYDEEGLLEEVIKSFEEKKEYAYGENREYRHEIQNGESILEWKDALSSGFVRHVNSSTAFYAIGYGVMAFPPHGILFETEKASGFIGITRFGFHLGRWEGNSIDQSRLFYSPVLALLLTDYVKENNLRKFPKLYVNVLSGKNMIESMIELYESRKSVPVQEICEPPTTEKTD